MKNQRKKSVYIKETAVVCFFLKLITEKIRLYKRLNRVPTRNFFWITQAVNLDLIGSDRAYP